jgi:PAS domain S-box-containing protein
MNFAKLFREGSFRMVEIAGMKNDVAGLRQQAEKIASEQNLWQELDYAARPAEECQRIFHELQVHQIELEMQNDELRRTQEEKEQLKARYFSLYDLAPVGYWTVSSRGVVLEANYTMSRMLGLCRGELVGRPVTHFIYPQDQDNFHLYRKLFKPNNTQHFEARLLKADKTIFWADLAAIAVEGDNGEEDSRITVSDITRSKQAEALAQKLMREKDLLLKEVHHRIKNNLHTIYWLLMLHTDSLTGPAAEALEDAAARVQSMAALYGKLYQTEGFTEVKVQSYLPVLAEEIIRHFPQADVVHIQTEIDDFTLSQEKMAPVGMLLNELLTNMMKHAFQGRDSGVITIILTLDRSHVKMVIADNGIGLPEDVGFGENVESEGFGMSLVKMQVEQLQGTIVIERHYGTSFIVEFDLD